MMTSKLILIYENGAEDLAVLTGDFIPQLFHVDALIEGCRFWFTFIDSLPSGTLLFKEVSPERAMKIWRGEQ